MLVGFIGSPCSGKTTTAAKVFAEMKDCGQPVEYIAEKARSYIAEKRFMLRAKGIEHLFDLQDADQVSIAHSQYKAELIMNDKRLVVITDSCVLNSLLYMTPSARESREVQDLSKEALAKYDLLFICAPVPRSTTEDPNRVHDEAASMRIHEQINTLLIPMLEGKEVHSLTGTPHARMQCAFGHVMRKFSEQYG